MKEVGGDKRRRPKKRTEEAKPRIDVKENNRCFDHIADGGGGLGDFTRKRPGSCTSTPIRPRRSHWL